MSTRHILFEPWHLGDAVIAAALLREAPERLVLACNSKWHRIILALLPDLPPACLLAADLPHTEGGAKKYQLPAARPFDLDVTQVLSIRGDPRDYLAARRLFPGRRVLFTGWGSFAARRIWPLDLPFALGLLPVRNRYRAWAEICGVGVAQLTQAYAKAGRSRRASDLGGIIYCGARHASRRYPHGLALAAALLQLGKAATLVCGSEAEAATIPYPTQVLRDGPLIEALESAAFLVANDTGPMHIGAFVGCPTLVVTRVAAIEEWRPPLVLAFASGEAPSGYRPDRAYTSDAVLTGWPDPKCVATALTALLLNPSPLRRSAAS